MTEAAAGQLAHLRGLVSAATQRLLGDTIALSDEQWREPSRLPGWSRGHVATHVARQADALVRLCGWARTGERAEMYASAEHREREIEEGSGRSGLDLQIDLDTTAGRLDETFDQLDQVNGWDAEVEMRGGLALKARLLPLGRLAEVVLHHVDLDAGYTTGQIDDETAAWLLEWTTFRIRGRDGLPALHLVPDDGADLSVDGSGEPRTVRGSRQALLGWLTGRLPAEDVDGAVGLQLPAF